MPIKEEFIFISNILKFSARYTLFFPINIANTASPILRTNIRKCDFKKSSIKLSIMSNNEINLLKKLIYVNKIYSMTFNHLISYACKFCYFLGNTYLRILKTVEFFDNFKYTTVLGVFKFNHTELYNFILIKIQTGTFNI